MLMSRPFCGSVQVVLPSRQPFYTRERNKRNWRPYRIGEIAPEHLLDDPVSTVAATASSRPSGFHAGRLDHRRSRGQRQKLDELFCRALFLGIGANGDCEHRREL